MPEPVKIITCPHCGAKAPEMSSGFVSSYCPGCSQAFNAREDKSSKSPKQRFLNRVRSKGR